MMRQPLLSWPSLSRARAAAVFRWIASLLLTCVVATAAGCDGEDERKRNSSGASPEAASTEHFVGDADARFAPKGKAVSFVASATPALKPTGSLPVEASCVTPECHANLATARHVHGPVSERDCDSCHEEDAGGHRYPLKRGPVETCTFCHAVAGTQAHQHKALEKGCLSCHRPHESPSKFLLKADTVERVCASCHDLPMRKFAHDPFISGDCSVCHQAHQSDNAKLLRGGEGPEHCFSCHANTKQQIADAVRPHTPARQDCTTCHGPHSTDFAHQLNAAYDQTCLTADCHAPVRKHMESSPVQHAAMLADKACSNCHDAHGTTQPALLNARMDAVCLTCHNKPIEATDGHEIPDMRPALADAKFLHGPIRAGDCSACHDAHGAAQPGLLTGAFPRTFYTAYDAEKYALCFTCHDRELVETERTASLTGFRDGNVNLHYLHVHRDEKGRTCKSCHAIHGSNQPKHIAADVPFERGQWAMAIGYEMNEQGGTCTPGCHKARDYRRDRPAAVEAVTATGSTTAQPTTQTMQTRGEP